MGVNNETLFFFLHKHRLPNRTSCEDISSTSYGKRCLILKVCKILRYFKKYFCMHTFLIASFPELKTIKSHSGIHSI